MNIGTIIRTRRADLGLTLEDVGKAVGVSKSTVKKWEDGFIENMRRDKIATLASVLKISPVSLITGELILAEHSDNNFHLTEHEMRLIRAYRSQPSLQIAVDRTLGISDEDTDKKKKRA